jgi:hypothetical protein
MSSVKPVGLAQITPQQRERQWTQLGNWVIYLGEHVIVRPISTRHLTFFKNRPVSLPLLYMHRYDNYIDTLVGRELEPYRIGTSDFWKCFEFVQEFCGSTDINMIDLSTKSDAALAPDQYRYVLTCLIHGVFDVNNRGY